MLICSVTVTGSMIEISLKRCHKFTTVAKALNITHINCPDLKVGAIENYAHTGL